MVDVVGQIAAAALLFVPSGVASSAHLVVPEFAGVAALPVGAGGVAVAWSPTGLATAATVRDIPIGVALVPARVRIGGFATSPGTTDTFHIVDFHLTSSFDVSVAGADGDIAKVLAHGDKLFSKVFEGWSDVGNMLVCALEGDPLRPRDVLNTGEDAQWRILVALVKDNGTIGATGGMNLPGDHA